MKSYAQSHARAMLLLAVGVGSGMALGVLAAPLLAPRNAPPELLLHATATDSGPNMAIATGPIDEEMEGVFTLDFPTGMLSMAVLSPRKLDAVSGFFRRNVTGDLPVDREKKPAYLMVTGEARFSLGRTALANCVVYVVDQNTGDFAAYGIPWTPSVAKAGKPQGGKLVLLRVGKTREAELGQQ